MIAGRLRYTGPEQTAETLDRIAELSRMLTKLRQRLVEPL